MQLRIAIIILSTAAVLAACAAQEAASPGDDCGARGYQGVVGTPLAAATFPDTIEQRIIEPGIVVTTDYVPSRMNIQVGASGVIERIYCG